MPRLTILLVVTCTIVFSLPAIAGTVIATVPDQPDTTAKYLFYLHGRGIDDGADTSAYERVVRALSDLGLIVISEARPAGVIKKFPDDHEKYAQKVADSVDKLLAAGVPAGKITVSGYSRGGVLTVIASALIGNPDVRFVVMAGCVASDGKYKRAIPTFHKRYTPKLKGLFLSLRDSEDEDFGSCADFFSKAVPRVKYKEIVLTTGKGHAAFVVPADEWMQPTANWANGSMGDQ